MAAQQELVVLLTLHFLLELIFMDLMVVTVSAAVMAVGAVELVRLVKTLMVTQVLV